MKEELTEIINQVFKILKPLSESSGQHSFSVIFRSRSWGAIEFMLNWKCFKGELEFNSTTELLQKAQQLLEMSQEIKL
jgi:hypothetical protein